MQEPAAGALPLHAAAALALGDCLAGARLLGLLAVLNAAAPPALPTPQRVRPLPRHLQALRRVCQRSQVRRQARLCRVPRRQRPVQEGGGGGGTHGLAGSAIWDSRQPAGCSTARGREQQQPQLCSMHAGVQGRGTRRASPCPRPAPLQCNQPRSAGVVKCDIQGRVTKCADGYVLSTAGGVPRCVQVGFGAQGAWGGAAWGCGAGDSPAAAAAWQLQQGGRAWLPAPPAVPLPARLPLPTPTHPLALLQCKSGGSYCATCDPGTLTCRTCQEGYGFNPLGVCVRCRDYSCSGEGRSLGPLRGCMPGGPCQRKSAGCIATRNRTRTPGCVLKAHARLAPRPAWPRSLPGLPSLRSLPVQLLLPGPHHQDMQVGERSPGAGISRFAGPGELAR